MACAWIGSCRRRSRYLERLPPPAPAPLAPRAESWPLPARQQHGGHTADSFEQVPLVRVEEDLAFRLIEAGLQEVLQCKALAGSAIHELLRSVGMGFHFVQLTVAAERPLPAPTHCLRMEVGDDQVAPGTHD